ncbi:hypothetical protein Cha6605_4621 [Chamaesiphon minutus PCC 6605]|uniref:Uncharacterized protein n=1 Tax=Chamaesiphon minutus (strain ATCC 27169 / PCC 6605) TaxID=1173020 RepID=K9UMW2_CHAP6|nr:hypothetical protein Cha6605_4621 [Chamaesiphon minutus PCC 6605]
MSSDKSLKRCADARSRRLGRSAIIL